MTSGPRFLRRLELDLTQRLSSIDSDPSLNRFTREEMRCEAFRSTFASVAEEMRTFGPLLSRIREAYEGKIGEVERELKHSQRERKK